MLTTRKGVSTYLADEVSSYATSQNAIRLARTLSYCFRVIDRLMLACTT